MRTKMMVAGTLAAAVLGASAPAFAQSANPGPATKGSASKAASCDADGHWPAYVQGMPDGFDAGDDGAYVWHNPSGGWGLRVSHPVLSGKADKVVFSGTITTKGRIFDVTRVKDEKDDRVKVTHHGHTLTFRFVNYGGVDGVNFATSCTPGLRVNLRVDKGSMPVRFIHLGDHKVNPDSDPFTVRRRDADTTTAAK